MVDTCLIERKTGETTTGGVITPTWSTVYQGRCRLKSETTMGQGADIGEAYRVIGRHVLQLPVTATGLAEGDRVTMSTSALDPDLPGRVYVLREVNRATHATRRELTLIEVTS